MREVWLEMSLNYKTFFGDVMVIKYFLKTSFVKLTLRFLELADFVHTRTVISM